MESLSHHELDQHILNILNDNPKGLEDEILTKKLKHVKEDDRVNSLNRLISQNRIAIIQTETGLAYKYIDEEEAVRLNQLSTEEIIVYQIIEESHNKGIWINDIKKKAGKLAPKAQKTVERLSKLGFIKSIKTIKAKNRKVWMIMSVEPSPEVTGGLGADDIFDLGVMEQLGQLGVDYTKAQGRADRKEISSFLRAQGLTKIELTDEDVYRILNTQIFDGKLEVIDDNLGNTFTGHESGSILPNNSYKVSNWYTPRIVFTEIPCAFGSLMSQGGDGQLVSPQECKYYAEWF